MRIDASRATSDLLQALVREYQADHPRERLTVLTGMRSPDRVQAISAGTADVAVVNEDLSPEDLGRHGLVTHEIARTVVVFAVHPSVRIAGLTRRQLCDIYSGGVTNWRALGGEDLRIRAGVRQPSEDDTRDPLAPLGCGAGFRYSVDVQAFERVEDVARAIADTPGGIGLTSLASARSLGERLQPIGVDGVMATDAAVQSGAYAFTRAVVLVSRAKSSAAFERLLDFVRGPVGQRVIQGQGAVAIPVKS